MIVIARNRPSTSPANVEPLSGSHQCMRLSPRLVHLAAKLKSAVLVSLPATVTVAVCVPYFSCQASIVYVPGGRPLIAKLPSPPLTPKNGWGSTPSHACIHPCTLHSSATMTSGLSNVFVEVITAGWLMLKGRLAFAFALTISPPAVMTSTKTFDKPEVMVALECNVHGWMHAWLGVLPHSFFGVSGSDGSFAIKGLPPGTYTI